MTALPRNRSYVCAMSRGARNYMVTVFGSGEEDLPLLDPFQWPEWVTFFIYQRELCPDTNREHFQGYIELSVQKRMTELHHLEGLETAHFAVRHGNQRQAIAYCSKEDSKIEGPWIFGAPKNQGQRTDLDELKRSLDQRKSLAAIADEHFAEFLKYQKGIYAYKRIRTEQRVAPPNIVVIVGPSGTGKTRAALKLAPHAYWKTNGKWWDGYDNQATVIWDEFYGHSYPFSELLRLLDRYPYSVEVKGGTVEFTSPTIIFTSNQEPEDWYDKERTHQMVWLENPLNRRLREYGKVLRTGQVHRAQGRLERNVGLRPPSICPRCMDWEDLCVCPVAVEPPQVIPFAPARRWYVPHPEVMNNEF